MPLDKLPQSSVRHNSIPLTPEEQSYFTTQFKQCLERFRGESEKNKIEAANDLRRLGIEYRGGIFPRGNADSAAALLIPPALRDELVSLMMSSNRALRKGLLLALSNWVDDSIHPSIQHIIATTKDKVDVNACVLAMQIIGGPKNCETLSQLAAGENIDEMTRRRCRSVIGILETGGSYDLAEPWNSSEEPVQRTTPLEL